MGDHFKRQCILLLICYVSVSSCLPLEINRMLEKLFGPEEEIEIDHGCPCQENRKTDTTNFCSVFVLFCFSFVLCYLVGLHYLYSRNMKLVKNKPKEF